MVMVVVGVILFKVLPVFDEVLRNLGVSLTRTGAGADAGRDGSDRRFRGGFCSGIDRGRVVGWRQLPHSAAVINGFSICPRAVDQRVCRELSLAQAAFALSLFTRSGVEISEALQGLETLIEHRA